MSENSDNSCVLLSAKDSRASSIFPAAEEKDNIPKVGDDSVLEMLSFSKFSDLETWLCMPSDLLQPRSLDSSLTSSQSLSSSHVSIHSSYLSAKSSPSPASSLRLSTCSEPGDTDKLFREYSFLSSSVGKEDMFLSTPFLPNMSSTPSAVSEQSSKPSAPDSTFQTSVIIKKRRRLAASPGGLHWNSAGSLQRDFSSADPFPSETGVGAKRPGCKMRPLPIRGVGGATHEWAGEKPVLMKSISCDGAQLKLLSRLDQGCRKLRGIQSLGTTGRYDCKKRTNSKISRLAQRWNRTPTPDDLIRHLKPLDHTVTPRSSLSLDRYIPAVRTLQMQNLQLSQSRKCPGGPASPSAAKRLYRNLSEKLRGSTSSFEDAYFFGKTDRLRKASVSECIFEAVEQQDLDTVQILLYQFSAEEVDLNTPNSQGLTPLDIAIMTNNMPIAKLLLKAGGKESPHCKDREDLSSQDEAVRHKGLNDVLRPIASSMKENRFHKASDGSPVSMPLLVVSECIFEAVEQQDLDTVQILLYQFSAEEVDLNTPNSQGLTPLDIAIMTNNMPIAKLLLKAGGKESPHFVTAESREAHLRSLVEEAERRAAELAAQTQRDGQSLEACHQDKQLMAWQKRSKLYKRMRTGFQHARPPDSPSRVRLSVTSSTTLTVTFQEPQCLNSTMVTKYRVEWSCLKDFSLLAGEVVLDNLQNLRWSIGNLSTGRVYYVRVSAYNMKGWGPPATSLPPSAAPSNWRENAGQKPRRRGQIEAMERLLQQVRATHTHYCCGDTSKMQNQSRKQSVSRSLKHLFNSSNKFVKTLKRGIYLVAVFYHKDSLLVTAEDQIPIVEVDDSYSSSLMQDFLWFTKLSCMWEDVRWLRQSMSVSMSSSSTLQARHKMLSAASQMQSLLGTHNLGRVHFEPIKDRHGNVLLVTIRDTEMQHSLLSGKWMLVTKLQSQKKSLSTPEEPYALDILIITMQDILAYHRRSCHRLTTGLYLGYLKLSSSVDQIKVLVSQRTPNMLCHTRIRENANVSREEWEWIQMLAAAGRKGCIEGDSRGEKPEAESHTPLLYYELQTALKSLMKHLNLPLHQAYHFRLYSQEVVELGHGVSFLLLLPPADDVCSAPGQSNPYTFLSGFLQLPLQMFELIHFCTYKERFISLYCRLSSVLDLDSLITQQALREAITDSEVTTAKNHQQLILDYIQQLDEMRRDLRWLTDALQYARYKQPCGGVPIMCLMDAKVSDSDYDHQRTDSPSSTMNFLPTPSPSPSPEHRRRKAISDSQHGSDEDASSEVFLPTDSDYDSSDALSPQNQNLLCSPDLSQQACYLLGGSAPDVLQIQELRYSTCSPTESPTSTTTKDTPLPSPCLSSDSSFSAFSLSQHPRRPRIHMSPSLPFCPSFSNDLPLSLPLSASLSDTTKTLESLSLSKEGSATAGWLTNPPTKRKWLSRSHRSQYFSGPQRWLRGNSGESLTGSLSEGIYTKQIEPDLPLSGDLPSSQGPTYISHVSCVLDNHKSPQKQPLPLVHRICVEPCWEKKSKNELAGKVVATGVSVVVGQVEFGGIRAKAEEATTQEMDSDDQTNSQMSEILSSML